MTFPSFTFPVAPPPDNYKSILYTQKQVKEFEKTKSKTQRAYSFYLRYKTVEDFNPFYIFGITSHMLNWPESQASQEVKDYAFCCFYNEQLKNNLENKENYHKIYTMTKHDFNNPFIIKGLIVNEEIFFFSTIECLGTCQIYFNQKAKSFFGHGFSYKEVRFLDLIEGFDKKKELNMIDKIKTSLETFFHAPQA